MAKQRERRITVTYQVAFTIKAKDAADVGAEAICEDLDDQISGFLADSVYPSEYGSEDDDATIEDVAVSFDWQDAKPAKAKPSA